MLGYTSGTTAERKPVLLSHLNFISGQVCEEYLGFNFRPDDVYLSYVPLTHVYEQILHVDACMFGFRIGYASGDLQNLINDIQKLQPTIFGSFPSFYTKLYKKIKENLNDKSGWMVQKAFEYAFEIKLHNYISKGSINHMIFDSLLFN